MSQHVHTTSILAEIKHFYWNVIVMAWCYNTKDLPSMINKQDESINYRMLLDILHGKLLTHWCCNDYMYDDCILYLSILVDSSYKHDYKQFDFIKHITYKYILRGIYGIILVLWPFISLIVAILWYFLTQKQLQLGSASSSSNFMIIYTWLVHHFISLFEYRTLHYKNYLSIFQILDVVLQCHYNHSDSDSDSDSDKNDEIEQRFFVTDYFLRIFQTWMVTEYRFLESDYKIELKNIFYPKCFENNLPIVDTFGLHFDKFEQGCEYIVKPNGGMGGNGVFFVTCTSDVQTRTHLYSNIMHSIQKNSDLYKDLQLECLQLGLSSSDTNKVSDTDMHMSDSYNADYIDSHFMIQKRIHDYHSFDNLRVKGYQSEYISMFRMYTRCNYDLNCTCNINTNNKDHTYSVINNTHLRFDYDNVFVLASNKFRLSIYLYIDCNNNDLIAFYPSKRVFKSWDKPFGRCGIDLSANKNTNLYKLCEIDMKPICNIISNAHKYIAPNIPVLSWDIAIDTNKNVKIIEANITYGYNIQEQLTFSKQESEYAHYYAYASAIEYFKNIANKQD